MENNLPRLLDPETVKKEFFSGDKQPNLNTPGVYKLFQRQDFPSFKIGRKWYISTPLFLEWLEKQGRNKTEIA